MKYSERRAEPRGRHPSPGRAGSGDRDSSVGWHWDVTARGQVAAEPCLLCTALSPCAAAPGVPFWPGQVSSHCREQSVSLCLLGHSVELRRGSFGWGSTFCVGFRKASSSRGGGSLGGRLWGSFVSWPMPGVPAHRGSAQRCPAECHMQAEEEEGRQSLGGCWGWEPWQQQADRQR